MTQDNNSKNNSPSKSNSPHFELTLENLQAELFDNPRSLNFTLLAEKYLEHEMPTEAEQLVRTSLKFHPKSISGYILLGQSLRKQNRPAEAIENLQKAVTMAPDNAKALSELAEIWTEQKNGKAALKCYKQILLYYPNHPLARRAIARLEVLTADEYEDDLFAMQPVQKLQDTTKKEIKNSALSLETTVEKNAKTTAWQAPSAALERVLAFIDALTVRLEIKKALEMLSDCAKKYGNHPEIEARRLRLSEYEKADSILPREQQKSSLAREELIQQKKLNILNQLLRRIEAKKEQQLST